MTAWYEQYALFTPLLLGPRSSSFRRSLLSSSPCVSGLAGFGSEGDVIHNAECKRR